MNYKNIIKYLKDPKSKANKVADKIALIFFAVFFFLFLLMVLGGMNSMDGGRKNGRDVRRVSDVKQLQAALDLYYDSCGSYPVVPTATIIGSPDFNTSFHEGCPEGTSMGTFMKLLPNNPTPGGEPYAYYGSRENYTISFSIEKQVGNFSAGKHFATPAGIQ